jgi:hypothetical protein
MPFKYLEFLKEFIISVCSLLFLALTAYEIISKKWHSIRRMHRQRHSYLARRAPSSTKK